MAWHFATQQAEMCRSGYFNISGSAVRPSCRLKAVSQKSDSALSSYVWSGWAVYRIEMMFLWFGHVQGLNTLGLAAGVWHQPKAPAFDDMGVRFNNPLSPSKKLHFVALNIYKLSWGLAETKNKDCNDCRKAFHSAPSQPWDKSWPWSSFFFFFLHWYC